MRLPSTLDRAHDLLPRRRPLLDAVFAPRAVALIGASERAGSVGRVVWENLRAGALRDSVYAVNPGRQSVLGVRAFARVGDIPHTVDLAVIATPAASVPAIVAECVAAGVPAAVIISAGFKECGAAGVELERQVMEIAQGRMRILGPNCLGVMVPGRDFNATFAPSTARAGSVGFISQSGAFCTAILDWSREARVGFSAFVSVGSMIDVDWGDLIYHLGDDPQTRSIVLYMESIGDARSFFSAAREVALSKPIIVLKVGRCAQAAQAAASHTGSLTGNDEVLSAAFRRAGVLRVRTIAELFEMAELLSKQPCPRGPRLAIVTNAGGPAAVATDMFVGAGGQMAALSASTQLALDELLPAFWSHGNPVDILGDAGVERYEKAVELVARDPGNDGVLVILSPQAMTESSAIARRLTPFAQLAGKPILASWMGGTEVREGQAILNEAGVPTYAYPDTAARAFRDMWGYAENLRALYETPVPATETEQSSSARNRAGKLIREAREQGRTLLSEVESKAVLQAYGIPVVETRRARTEAEAVALAKGMGSAVVLKLLSETITHKARAGGVKLDLRGAAAVKAAFKQIQAAVPEADFAGVSVEPMIQKQDSFELILGCGSDPQFGPVLLFGAGGALVEICRDRALGLPPLNTTLARRMMERTRIYTALRAMRGRAAIDLEALEQMLVRFSTLVVEQPWIAEIDVNPLLAFPGGFLALDARIVLHGAALRVAPRPAIRPYPSQYMTPWRLKDGTSVTLRPIRPEDEPLMVRFHGTLSEQSVRQRYLSLPALEARIAHERLTRICFNDYDREIALVADRKHPKTGEHEILGVGRLGKMRGHNEAEFALVISDGWQGKGLGTQLLKALLQIGRAEKIERVVAHMLPENERMRHMVERQGFRLEPVAGELRAELIL